MVPGQIVCKVSSQAFGIFNVGFSFWPPSKDGMIDNNTIIPRIKQAWLRALKNIGTSLELISWELLTIWEILLYGIINVISNRENGTLMTPAVWLTVMLIPFAMARILIERVSDTYLTLSPVSCTACRYCMPCPNGVDIPRIFEFYNEAVTYGDVVRRRRMYSELISALNANNA